MSAFCTHYLFGEDFIAYLPKEKKYNKSFRGAFFYGVHGPDFLLFHRALPTMPGKSLHSFSTRLHSGSPVLLFEELRKIAVASPDDNFVQGFVTGFLCHYALDRSVHPYIDFLAEAIIRSQKITYSASTVHNMIETSLDRYMLKKRLKLFDARKFMPSETLDTDKELIQSISLVMIKLIYALYGENIELSSVIRAFKDFRKIEDMLSDITYWKKPLAIVAELPVRVKYGPVISTLIRSGATKKNDFSNEAKNPWANVKSDGEVNRSSFIELYDKALEQALFMYEAFFEGEDMLLVTGNITFDHGIPFGKE